MSQAARIRIRRSTTTGQEPVNATSSSDHRDGTWSDLETYQGEMFLNSADHRLWINSGGSIKEVALGVGELKTASISLSSTEILALNTTPITVVPAIAGKEIQVVSASAALTYVSSTYATNTNMVLRSNGASNEQARFDISSGSTAKGSFDLRSYNDNIITGAALEVSVDGGDPTTGDGTMVISVTYRVIDL